MCDGCGIVEKKAHITTLPSGWIMVKITKTGGSGVLNGEFHSIQCLINALEKYKTEGKR